MKGDIFELWTKPKKATPMPATHVLGTDFGSTAGDIPQFEGAEYNWTASGYQWMASGSIAPYVLSEAPSVSAIRELSENIKALRDDIQHLAEVIRVSLPSREETVVYRDISKQQATEEISKLLESAGQLYPSDISETLRIDYDLVTEILKELRQQGKVEVG